MGDVKMSALAADTSIGGEEKLLALDSTTSKTITTAALAAYAIDTLVAAAEVVPTTGDALLVERSGTEGTIDLDDLADYCVASAWSEAAATTSPADADYVLIYQGSATMKATLEDLAEYVLAEDTTLGAKIAALSVATLADTDKYALAQDTTGKYTTWASMAARAHSQFAAYVGALTAVATVGATDKLYALQGSTAKYVTPVELATYMKSAVALSDLAWPSAYTTPASGHYFLMHNGSAAVKVDVDYLTEFFADGLQADVLDLSGLDAATLAGTDLLAVCQTTTAKKVALSDLETTLWADFVTYVAALTGVTTVSATDKFWVIQSGTAKSVTPAELATYFAGKMGTLHGPLVAPTVGNVPRWSSSENTLDGGLPIVEDIRSAGGEIGRASGRERV